MCLCVSLLHDPASGAASAAGAIKKRCVVRISVSLLTGFGGPAGITRTKKRPQLSSLCATVCVLCVVCVCVLPDVCVRRSPFKLQPLAESVRRRLNVHTCCTGVNQSSSLRWDELRHLSLLTTSTSPPFPFWWGEREGTTHPTPASRARHPTTTISSSLSPFLPLGGPYLSSNRGAGRRDRPVADSDCLSHSAKLLICLLPFP